MAFKALSTCLGILVVLSPCSYAQPTMATSSNTFALSTPATFAQNTMHSTYRTEVSQSYIGDFGELTQPNTTISREGLSSDPSKEPEAQSQAKTKARQDTQHLPKPDAHIEYILALLAAKEKHPEQADAHFREAVAAQRCGKYDRKLEAQIMSAYGKFLKSQHRLIEAKKIMTQLRTSQRQNHLLDQFEKKTSSRKDQLKIE